MLSAARRFVHTSFIAMAAGVSSVYDFKVKDSEGKAVDLGDKYRLGLIFMLILVFLILNFFCIVLLLLG